MNDRCGTGRALARLSGANCGPIWGQTFTPDAANSSLGHTASYTYDSFNRLLTAQANGPSQNCLWGVTMSGGYDQWGNLKTRSVTCGTATALSLSVNGSNQITNSGFGYDAAGNLTADGTHTYQWDAENRLVSVDGTAGQACQSTWTACYVYNALGQRVQKTVSGTTTGFIYEASGRLLAYTSGVSTAQDLIYLGNRLVANYITWTRFPHPNALGSTGMITDNLGAVSQDELFYPCGQSWQALGTIDDQRFASLGRRDAETGLDPTPNRLYSSQYGRWLRPDPAGLAAVNPGNPQSWNRYGYVVNSPLVLADAAGLAAGSSACMYRRARPMAMGGGGCGYGPASGGSGGVSIDGGPPLPGGEFSDGTVGGAGAGGGDSTVQCPDDVCGWVNDNGQLMHFVATIQGSGYYAWYGPGADYYSADEAGAAAVLYYEPMSASSDQNGNRFEYSGALYEDANDVYSYTGAVQGDPCAEYEGCQSPLVTTVPSGTTLVGGYHTHPWERGLYQFDWDSSAMGPVDYSGLPMYVATPVGGGYSVVKLTPSGGQCSLSGAAFPGLPGC